MEENKTTQTPQPKNEKKPGIFTLLIGFFLIIRGSMRLFEPNVDSLQITFGALMLLVGIAGIVYYFMKR